MQKIIITSFLFFSLTIAFGQTQRKISTYLSAQFDGTIYDATLGNNPWGMGLGLQTFFNNKTKFKPSIEVTRDIYLANNKLLRVNQDGSIPTTYNDVRGMVNLFGGASFHPNSNIYITFLAGPSFIGGYTLFGVKPSFGFYFSKAQRWTGKVSYINVFDRNKATKEDFGSVSFSVDLKLF